MRIALAGAMVAALAIAGPAGAAGPTNGAQSDSTKSVATVDRAYALVQLKGAPLSTYVKTKPAPGKKIDFTSDAVKARKAHLAALRNEFKAWLQKAAPRAQVVKGYDLSLNGVSVKLNGTSLATIRTSTLVNRVEYQGLYRPTMADPDLEQINGLAGWAAAGVSGADAGEGVKVAVIDSGIDVDHPCFDDAGYPARTQLGQRAYTNNKVIAAKVFNNKAVSRGYDAEAVDSHGTHVAGTIGCNFETPATVDGADIPYDMSGVAPRALLGNYNVFPGDVDNARSEDILNAMEAAYRDGFDIANMSLGGGANGIQDLLTIAVDNLDSANMVFAISAGNEGPGHYTVGSPGSAARALTAGAASVAHQVLSVASVDGVSRPGVLGEFGTPAAYPVTGTLNVTSGTGVSGLDIACAPLTGANAPSGSGQIALIQRGVCDFSLKMYYVQEAGYAAAIVANRVPGPPFTMGQGAAPYQATIPGWMITMDGIDAVKAKDGKTVSVGAPEYIHPFYLDGAMADFTSEGPTDVDFRVKPDVVAPGVNVLSSIPQSYCKGQPCFAFFNGTSMASPHLAGMAAIVRQAHPGWSAAEVRSAIVNTAAQGALTKADYTGVVVTDVNLIGAGKADLEAAVEAVVALEPVSISFGAVPSGSAQTKTKSLTLTNTTGSSKTYALSVGTQPSGVAFSVSPSSVTLAAGQRATVTVTGSFKAGGRSDQQATLTVKVGGNEVAHAVVYAFMK
ncbi:MAG TPA: S8 family serine peptidase [Candidatus Limnocylindrales bacterium]|nr:S8 family serine peptidase [Candidatus Limnocylindrales bacterium]